MTKGFPDGSVVKNPPDDVGDARGPGSIPVRECLLKEEMATHSSNLASRIPWTEPGGYGPWGCKELDTSEQGYSP